jgi:hypothetical protein
MTDAQNFALFGLPFVIVVLAVVVYVVADKFVGINH